MAVGKAHKLAPPAAKRGGEGKSKSPTTWPYKLIALVTITICIVQQLRMNKMTRDCESPEGRRQLFETGGGAVAGPCPACPTPAIACAACPTCPSCQACPAVQASDCPPCSSSGSSSEELEEVKAELAKTRKMYFALKADGSTMFAESASDSDLVRANKELKRKIEIMLEEKSAFERKGDWGSRTLDVGLLEQAKATLEACGKQSNKLVLGDPNIETWKGYACEATQEELKQYFDYEPRALCPDDWFFVQELIFKKNCFALPKRRCLNRTPRDPVPPVPFPQSLFSQAALDDRNMRWDLHWCKSFECLNTRSLGDCRNCFNMSLEAHRWKANYRGSLKMAEVIQMTKGSLRLGLDVGGGTGSFAAHMAHWNVTVMTTAWNVETVKGRYAGLPYHETIALRGLVPLHIPHKSRLPFVDNVLDIIHSVNSVKFLSIPEFEELMFEWDRVLRPGGVIWFEMFYCLIEEMPLYVATIDLLGYKKLYWNITPKPDHGEKPGENVYLNCLIQKLPRADKLNGGSS